MDWKHLAAQAGKIAANVGGNALVAYGITGSWEAAAAAALGALYALMQAPPVAAPPPPAK